MNIRSLNPITLKENHKKNDQKDMFNNTKQPIQKSIKQLTIKDINQDKLIQDISAVINEIAKFLFKNSDKSLTRNKKSALKNIIENSITSADSREQAEIFEYLLPNLVDSIENLMASLPSPKP
ncbi:hypothetical protein [Endozoicomonas elysicola]|uniref:Uncharacterized protein n=1 Tax=Endozoicomonas elysicola TaxID=305900 RepID=A0A081KGU9_9GAMM|nr:hypothetical protein [Endozoicomonas elysicola]KEI73375.1 hypothetical protein GV64_23990 [Endozoicomonas elysicola]